MTPAIQVLKKQKSVFTVHQYKHTKNSLSYGIEAVEAMGVDSKRVFKTLVIKLDSGELVVAILPVSEQLSLKLLAQCFTAKKAYLADKKEVLRSTGYVLGGVSPLGQKKRLKTMIDSSAFLLESIFVSAGKRGLEVALNAQILQEILQAKSAVICS